MLIFGALFAIPDPDLPEETLSEDQAEYTHDCTCPWCEDEIPWKEGRFDDYHGNGHSCYGCMQFFSLEKLLGINNDGSFAPVIKTPFKGRRYMCYSVSSRITVCSVECLLKKWVVRGLEVNKNAKSLVAANEE